ncbi:JmjC domain-containing histone demethylation protein 1 [Serendipita sp. 396]|nr:JmjC domain-containing histone demethylation protein 1 [Serendipita sp. 396]
MPPRRKRASNQALATAQGPDTPMEEGGGEAVAQEAELKCPGCKDGDEELNKEIWICCDACKTWYHWVCSGIDANTNSTATTGEAGQLLTPEQIDKWFCKSCVEQDPSRTMTLKPPPRKSGRKKAPVDSTGSDTVMSEPHPAAPATEPAAAAASPEVAAPATNATISAGAGAGAAPTSTTTPAPPSPPEVNKWIAIAESKKYSPDNFRRMNGSDIGMEWILRDESAMKEPIVIEAPEGLGMKMPPKEMTVRDVANEVGPDTHVEVIDVQSQSNCPGWTLGKWADYYHSDPTERDKIRNVISLEVSGTPLGTKILPPRLVRELDWVEKHWPHNKKQLGHYPKVQLYCLMSVAQCWTDWHIDFAGSSVYYHILHGSKVFYFIKPTAANLAAYEHWSGTDIQNHTWLGDMADEVVRVELTAGNTMIIPTGWIHAVYTPADTLVFGGNFLHSLNMKTQLRVRDIEIRTRVPKKFRFPLFTKLCWYVGEKYCKDLKAKEDFSPRVLKSLDALAGFLVSEARTIERGSEVAKKEAKENVPTDRVKDASLLARELRWRVRSAAGVDSDTELGGDGDEIVPIKREPGSARQGIRKRKDDHSTPLFKNWQAPEWSNVENLPLEVAHDTVRVEDVEKEDGWMAKEGISGDVMRSKKRNGITKIRKLDQGAIERYSVIRTVEIVTPSGALPKKEPL